MKGELALLDGSNLAWKHVGACVAATQELGKARDTAEKRLNISAGIKQLEVGISSNNVCMGSCPPRQQRQEWDAGWCRTPGKT